jgi:hypothetical protein
MATEEGERGNKRRLRTDDTFSPATPRLDRVLKLRLSDELAEMFGARFCTEAELVARMISNFLQTFYRPIDIIREQSAGAATRLL